jgi:murein DD-endopeptidase MepM/ murein hydrolase activator NlpD
MTMGQAAQAVQVSAFPGAYDKWADEASAILSSLNFTAKPGQTLQVGAGGWVRPASGPRTSPFGMRVNPVTGVYKLHAGSDIGAPAGASIRAAKTGTVVSAGMTSGYGNYTILDHGAGIRTAYAHQSRIGVRAGQTVKAGQVIGNVGSTGNSTGPHLHFEYMKNGVRVNPNQIIPGLKTGGFAMSDGLANLHKGESVLPARLTEKFKQNVANNTETGYNVNMDFTGATFAKDFDTNAFQKAVETALLNVESRKGANRKVS